MPVTWTRFHRRFIDNKTVCIFNCDWLFKRVKPVANRMNSELWTLCTRADWAESNIVNFFHFELRARILLCRYRLQDDPWRTPQHCHTAHFAKQITPPGTNYNETLFILYTKTSAYNNELICSSFFVVRPFFVSRSIDPASFGVWVLFPLCVVWYVCIKVEQEQSFMSRALKKRPTLEEFEPRLRLIKVFYWSDYFFQIGFSFKTIYLICSLV